MTYTSIWAMIGGVSWPNLVILTVLGLCSVISVWVIISKVRHFRLVGRQARDFADRIDRTDSLDEAYRATLALPDSPYTRLFRAGRNFYNELRPGVLAGPSAAGESGGGLSLTQLEALRLTMDKVEKEEADELAIGLNGLAVIGSVAPLLGLMGTVIGIIRTFQGISASGSANIAAVAPGVAGALVTTVVGLAVAIPSVIAYNHFAGRSNLILGELEGFAAEFIGTLTKEGRL